MGHACPFPAPFSAVRSHPNYPRHQTSPMTPPRLPRQAILRFVQGLLGTSSQSLRCLTLAPRPRRVCRRPITGFSGNKTANLSLVPGVIPKRRQENQRATTKGMNIVSGMQARLPDHNAGQLAAAASCALDDESPRYQEACRRGLSISQANHVATAEYKGKEVIL